MNQAKEQNKVVPQQPAAPVPTKLDAVSIDIVVPGVPGSTKHCWYYASAGRYSYYHG